MYKKVAADTLGLTTSQQQASIMTAAGITGAAVSYAFGGWSELLGFFLLAISIDYATGVFASLKEGKGLSSSVGFWGLAKKVFMLVVVMLGHRMDILLGTNVLMTGAIYFYLVNELISITENYGRLGLPMPPKLKEMIQVLKAKGDASDDKGL